MCEINEPRCTLELLYMIYVGIINSKIPHVEYLTLEQVLHSGGQIQTVG